MTIYSVTYTTPGKRKRSLNIEAQTPEEAREDCVSLTYCDHADIVEVTPVEAPQ